MKHKNKETKKINLGKIWSRKQIVVLGLVFLTVGAGIFVWRDYQAKGATYGWIQATWVGGVFNNQSSCETAGGTWVSASSQCIATHDNNKTGWTGYASKDTNVTAGDTVTLNSSATSVTDTTTANFNLGADTNGILRITHASDELKLTWVCGDLFPYSGENYPTILIGTQCWLAKNLNVGTMVTGATTQTNNGTIEKHCYNNTASNCTTYGGLYQWNEAMQYVTTAGARGICPVGWHIPTDAEQYTLENYLKIAGQACSATRTAWECNDAGTKLKPGGSSGFNGLLAGDSIIVWNFLNLGTNGFFWSSSVSGTNAWSRQLASTVATVGRSVSDQMIGFSVRCLKD